MTGFGFFQRNQWLTAAMKHAGTTYKGRAVAAALTTFHNAASGQCNPSVKTLGERAGLKETATRQGVQELVAAGLLAVQHKTGGASQYDIILPAGTPSQYEGHPLATQGTTPSPHEPKHLSLTSKRNMPAERPAKAEDGSAKKRCGTEAPATPTEFTPEQRATIAKHEPLLTGNAAGRFTVARSIGEMPAPDGSDAWRWQIVKAAAAGHLRS